MAVAEQAHFAPERDPVVVINAERNGREALTDLGRGLMRSDLWWRFAVVEVRSRFRRSLLGPLWITLSMAITVGALGLVIGALLGQSIVSQLPYIATGLVFWGFINSCVAEGCSAFITSSGYITNIPMPISVHWYRMLARNLIVLGFNMLIYFGVAAMFTSVVNANIFMVVPGFVLLLISVAWMSLVGGLLSARYRDIPQIVINAMQVVFYLTPVFWSPSTMAQRPAFVEFNPLYHLLELVRAPLLGNAPSTTSWIVSIATAIIGSLAAVLLYRRTYTRISYWL